MARIKQDVSKLLAKMQQSGDFKIRADYIPYIKELIEISLKNAYKDGFFDAVEGIERLFVAWRAIDETMGITEL